MLVGNSELRMTHAGHSELGVAASTKAVWWDLRLARLLTHLFLFSFALRISFFCPSLPFNLRE